ncbi:hypothetical protein SpAn4DRAFT_3592 [Sporomusa ovata]|uniref:Uncharacterized protein n=1 Tax=Sporomusa ovata TaxID=2378 RepID=A0A0U1KWL8_9FIRM|nr:hypothetical protein SpAn4DRAFT_3592 [Sporomusa ovata]
MVSLPCKENLNPISHYLWGSVIENVIKTVHCHVLVIR